MNTNPPPPPFYFGKTEVSRNRVKTWFNESEKENKMAEMFMFRTQGEDYHMFLFSAKVEFPRVLATTHGQPYSTFELSSRVILSGLSLYCIARCK